MNKLLLKSPAKINLDLTILNKLKNGYHEINTSFQLIDLFDEIEFESSKNNISLSSNLKELNSDDNIITTVARKLKNSNSKLGVKIKLKKLIPIGAGLGGGSSNAASTIVALNKLWDLKMSKSEMHNFARNIGADVPFFLFGQNAQGNGIGDILKYKDSITDNILIIDPMIFSSTEEMYREYDLIRKKNKIIKDNPNNNDFLDIFLEKNNQVKEFYENNAQEFEIRLSGSGSCMFVIYNDQKNIQKFIKKIPSNWRFFSCKPLQYSPICYIK